jgi:hypothetical protein
MTPSAPALHCRQIEESDTEAVASLLANGFRTHDRQFWLQAFAQLRRQRRPPVCRNLAICWRATAVWSAPSC